MGNANSPQAQAQGNKALLFAKRTMEHRRHEAIMMKAVLTNFQSYLTHKHMALLTHKQMAHLTHAKGEMAHLTHT